MTEHVKKAEQLLCEAFVQLAPVCNLHASVAQARRQIAVAIDALREIPPERRCGNCKHWDRSQPPPKTPRMCGAPLPMWGEADEYGYMRANDDATNCKLWEKVNDV